VVREQHGAMIAEYLARARQRLTDIQRRSPPRAMKSWNTCRTVVLVVPSGLRAERRQKSTLSW
jgi:hypothetical protein